MQYPPRVTLRFVVLVVEDPTSLPGCYSVHDIIETDVPRSIIDNAASYHDRILRKAREIDKSRRDLYGHYAASPTNPDGGLRIMCEIVMPREVAQNPDPGTPRLKTVEDIPLYQKFPGCSTYFISAMLGLVPPLKEGEAIFPAVAIQHLLEQVMS